ncbi:MAG: aminotransferase class I/II-fold pyridoxal phosphate-dependent enzyme [Capnocytophaga sp.]|nr:aminotransferase class I/II-fold pyridoxal phosphate-dependent enzyme [Capnocytophaga sp.]
MREPRHLQEKLIFRKTQNSLRSLKMTLFEHDFFSNDYLGFARSEEIRRKGEKILSKNYQNGATGSRLLSGNYALLTETERLIADYHRAENALLFNSGYDANVGFFSSVPQRNDVVLYDAFIHASIRDGLQMGAARTYKFQHNDVTHLEFLLKKHTQENSSVYVATESVFSMDGDTPDLHAMAYLCERYGAFLVVDEAHSAGVFGKQGEGLVPHLGLENAVFARIVTYGKAFGCHGAAVLGSANLIDFLINFARSFIYTTAMSPHSVAVIKAAYQEMKTTGAIVRLHQAIEHFRNEMLRTRLAERFIPSRSSIQALVVSGNSRVKSVSAKLQSLGFGVMPILSPTVAEGEERLRFCLHSYNTKESISALADSIAEVI